MKATTRFILNMYKNNKRELTKIILIAAFGSLLAVIIPYVYGKLFDYSLLKDTPINLLFSLVGVWLVLSLVSTYITNKTSLRGEILGAKVSLETEANAYSHFLTLPISFHKKEQRESVFNKIRRGADMLQGLIETVSDIFPQFLMLIFSLVAMVLIQWQLAFIILFSFFIYGFITFKMMEPILKERRKVNKIYEKEYGSVYNKLYNVFLVKNFAMEKSEKKKFFNSIVKKIIPAVEKTTNKATKLSIIQGIIHSISFVAVLGTAIIFLRIGSITPGEFVMFFGYVNLVFAPFRFLSRIYRIYKNSAVSINRLLRLQKMVPEAMKHGDKTLGKVKGEIKFDDVSFGYIKEKNVLNNIDLLIKPGENIALVGGDGQLDKSRLEDILRKNISLCKYYYDKEKDESLRISGGKSTGDAEDVFKENMLKALLPLGMGIYETANRESERLRDYDTYSREEERRKKNVGD